MKHFDAIVVGGGPAGSTTAYRLAEQGASVLLADKATFPRDKPCGGGMTMRAVRQCPVDPSPVVEELVDQVELRFRYRASVVRHTAEPVVWMTQRYRLDAFLLDAARERGVDVREGVKVAIEPGNTVVLGSGERVTADAIVGADGANGTTAKTVGLGGGITYGVAYEGNVKYPTLPRERYARRLVLELADIPGGYAWVFPKGDHANVGVGGWQSEGPNLREHLRRACEAHGLDPDDLGELRGHRLPLRRSSTQIAGERALLVGDAAGLIDPVSGDGMYECFVSSRLAAGAILDLLGGRSSTLEPYTTAVDRELAPLHRASWKLKQALDRWPRASWEIARSKLLWVSIRGMLDGELPDPAKQRGLARIPLRALAILGR
ncbi:MAG TPA: geranylgeranyl reductase family protein [Gaiellaceae bacterium]|nr:geranylgeranyl reductase family protein [Gaiellaceae bacterium]